MGPFFVTQPNPTHGSTQPMDNSALDPAKVYAAYATQLRLAALEQEQTSLNSDS